MTYRRNLLVAERDLAPRSVEKATCVLAGKLIAQKQYQSAADLVKALTKLPGQSATACEEQAKGAAKGLTKTTTSADVGEWWDSFQKSVVGPLSAVLGGIAAAVLGLVVIARLLALLPLYRHPVFDEYGKPFWVAGLIAILVVPIAMAVRALWLMRSGGPEWPDMTTLGVIDFARNLLAHPGWWWALVVLALGGAAAFATIFTAGRGVQVSVNAKKSGLDNTRILASVHAMIGRPNRGLWVPVGTDVTAAAEAVKSLSDNKIVAALQAFAVALLGSRPWRLIVESDPEAGTSDSVSVAVARNGVVLSARRVSTATYPPLKEIPERATGDHLAAFVAAELVAAMAALYPEVFQSGLHGATKANSIAIHQVVSEAIQTRTYSGTDSVLKQLAGRAVELDPSNGSAAATRWFLLYRYATGRNLQHYAILLDRAILQIAVHCPQRKNAGQPPSNLESAIWTADPTRLAKDDLLLRLAQTREAVERNLDAGANGWTPSAGPRATLKYLLSLRVKDEDGLLLAQREMLALITLYVESTRPPQPITLDPPAGLTDAQVTRWNAVTVLSEFPQSCSLKFPRSRG